MINIPGSGLELESLRVPQPTQEQSTELGQEDFLALMVEQFSNQDPFQPLENGEFISQMAQFSQVSGIAEMSESLQQLSDSLAANQALQAATIVGRSVLAEGELATLGEDASLRGGIDVPFATNNASVRIYDRTGAQVQQISLGSRGPGISNFEWDGTLPNGELAEPGTYRIAAVIQNGSDEEAVGTLVATPVESVALTGGGRSAQITTAGGQELSLSQIKAIM